MMLIMFTPIHRYILLQPHHCMWNTLTLTTIISLVDCQLKDSCVVTSLQIEGSPPWYRYRSTKQLYGSLTCYFKTFSV